MASNEVSPESRMNRLFAWLAIGIVGLVCLYGASIVAITWPVSRFSVEAAGKFADSFGILTTLFSGLAFAGLIWTILLQRTELKLQRDELVEARRQAVLTRLMTITQNQISSYRSEIGVLSFESISSPGEQYSTSQMIFTMNAYLEQLAQKSAKNEEVSADLMIDYLHVVASSVRSYLALVQGLRRCCKANRYLLTNESINAEEATDIKSMMFSDLPTGLMTLVVNLDTALHAYLEATTKKGNKIDLFDPFRRLQSDCRSILDHQEHDFTDANLEEDRKQKWLFAR